MAACKWVEERDDGRVCLHAMGLVLASWACPPHCQPIFAFGLSWPANVMGRLFRRSRIA